MQASKSYASTAGSISTSQPIDCAISINASLYPQPSCEVITRTTCGLTQKSVNTSETALPPAITSSAFFFDIIITSFLFTLRFRFIPEDNSSCSFSYQGDH